MNVLQIFARDSKISLSEHKTDIDSSR